MMSSTPTPPPPPAPTTALELLSSPLGSLRLLFGEASLDALLNGRGLGAGVTELVGEAASGKTQVCMQLALRVQLPASVGGLGGGACFISTENQLHKKRLSQMTRALRQRYPDEAQGVDFSEGIFFSMARSVARLQELFASHIPALLEARHIRLIVIDSIAALFRTEAQSRVEAIERSVCFAEISAQLRQWSERFGCVVLVTNQVSDVTDDDMLSRGEMRCARLSSGRFVKPALGLSWAKCVNTRLLLTREREPDGAAYVAPRDSDSVASSQDIEPIVRELHVISCPYAASTEPDDSGPAPARFCITKGGVSSAAAE